MNWIITLVAGEICEGLVNRMIKEFGPSKTLKIVMGSIGIGLTAAVLGMNLIPNDPNAIVEIKKGE